MDPAHPSALRVLLQQFGVHPRKRLGQHFLCDGNVLARIAGEAMAHGPFAVVEIGAGCGSLTLRLAEASSNVVAVEVDAQLVPVLQHVLRGRENVRIMHADFLRLETRELFHQAFGSARGVVAGNIPYGITAPILERVFDCSDRLVRAVLLVQSEVADRLTAKPGTPEYGSLTVFAAYYGVVRRILNVPRHLFYPAPEVGSALVSFTPGSDVASAVRQPELFFRVVRAAFGQRRKTLPNALAAGGLFPSAAAATDALSRCGVDRLRRGETLSPEEFASLANQLAGIVGDAS